MTAEERGYPMEKELFNYVAERAEVLATNDASTQVTKDAAAAWKVAVAAMLAEQFKRKEAGAKYCNCPSCTAASELLAKFGRIEM